jgi:hypothetical protein
LQDYYQSVVGPTPEQIASSLGLFGRPKLCRFVMAPRSRKGSNQSIYGMVYSVKSLDRHGPSWVILVKDLSISGSSAVLVEKQIKIYYHVSRTGTIAENQEAEY